jgi:hypothetical protein
MFNVSFITLPFLLGLFVDQEENPILFAGWLRVELIQGGDFFSDHPST